MVFVKHNSLKSDIFFNLMFIPGFSGSRFFRAQVFEGPGFPGSGSRGRVWVRVRVHGPGSGPGSASGSRVQGPGPGFRSRQQFSFFYMFSRKASRKKLLSKSYTEGLLLLLKEDIRDNT